jgi:hypothetical protein
MTQFSNFDLNSDLNPNNIEDYVLETPAFLPIAHWTLTIEKGDAWIFCNHGNFILKAGESASFAPSDGAIRIRRLYNRGLVKYHATKYA